MRLWKKAVSLVLVSAMAFSMCACGSKKDEGSKSADTFKIGGIGPITGDAAIYGKAVQNGIKLAVDEVNAAGGINGKKIEYNPDCFHSYLAQSSIHHLLYMKSVSCLTGILTSRPCMLLP